MPRMIGNIFKNILTGPVTRRHPYQRREPFPGSRGAIIFKPARCEFCGDCERACPSHAIRLDTIWDDLEKGARDYGKNNELTWVHVYDPCRCIFCSRCIEVCAYGALSQSGDFPGPSGKKMEERNRVESWV
ncbi:MAG: 4Fe-4S dicluster domain-containing protein [Peptococcaceae bacterium]|nr:4Fe-4S dicluster domain-containing protein [Peptococcaceae bacterium]